MEHVKAHQLIKKNLDLVLSLFDTFVIISIELSFRLQGRKVVAWVVDRQDRAKPIRIFSFPDNLVVGEIGGDSKVEFIPGADSEDESTN